MTTRKGVYEMSEPSPAEYVTEARGWTRRLCALAFAAAVGVSVIYLPQTLLTDLAASRLPLRPKHRQWLLSLGDTNVLSGPTDTATGVLVFEATDADAVHALLDQDPFQAGGVIKAGKVVQWTPMTGRLIDTL